MLVCGGIFYLIMVNLHDYRQTRQALLEYKNNTNILFPVIFYFINEAGSGIKYAFTHNERHLAYFPITDNDSGSASSSEIEYELAVINATNNDWREQVRLSHILALGWGTKINIVKALEWYFTSKETATDKNELEAWENHSRRVLVYALLKHEIDHTNLTDNLDTTWKESNLEEEAIIILETQRR